ncbi:MAG: carboxymuconolactone decarboxylase family protein [Pikeienuella sp.]
MTDFTRYTIETATAEAKPLLEGSLKAYGMIPNLHAVLAESPEIYEAYRELNRLFAASSLSTVETHVVWLTLNVYHRCHYCVPAHTFLAYKDGVSEEIVTALREERELPDARLEALRQFTLAVARERGFVAPETVDAFIAAGFTKRNVFDVILGLSHKVISNYVNHIVDTPVDAPFAKFDWQPVRAAAE